MGEEDSTTPVRNLEVSISFGRFENDLLSWEKWSSFSQNKYLEEVEKCATPGSVAEKKAYFEARNKLIAVRKAEMLNKQMEMCQKLNQENGIRNSDGEVNQYDEEVIEESFFGMELSRPGMNEHRELETTVYVSQEPDEKDVIEEISTNQFITDETMHMSETSYPLVVDSTSFTSESKMLNKYDPDENMHDSIPEFDKYDGQSAAERVQEEPILKIELSRCEIDQPFNMKTFVLGPAQTDGDNQVGDPSGTGSSKIDVYIDVPEEIKEEVILNSELSPNMLDQLKVDDTWPGKSSSPIEGEHVNVKSKNTEDIPALKTEKTDVEPKCDRELPNISDGKSARTQKMKPNPHPQKSSKKTFPAIKQNCAENVKKTLVSIVPRSPQMSTPKISKLSTPTVKSASRSLPVSRVKKTSASVPVVPKSPQVSDATGSTSRSTTPSLKPSTLSPSKNGANLLPSRKKSILAGVSRKLKPPSLHMSLNFGSKVSGSTSGPTQVTEPRKSLFMEKMGDKDIVKRAFKAFQYMSTPVNSVSIDTNATPKQVINKTDGKPSTPILQKEMDRLIKKGEVDVQSNKPVSVFKSDNRTLHSKEDKRLEAKKVTGKTEQKEAANSHLLAKYKEYRESHTGDQRLGLTHKATTQPGLYKRQSLSKSFQDKGAFKSELRQ